MKEQTLGSADGMLELSTKAKLKGDRRKVVPRHPY